MKLYIDTSDREKIILKIDEKKFETSSKNKNSQKLLPFIDKTLKKNNLSINDIAEIKVNTGPGSFTGLRVGVAIANAIRFALGIPINGKLTGVDKIVYK